MNHPSKVYFDNLKRTHKDFGFESLFYLIFYLKKERKKIKLNKRMITYKNRDYN
jgi:hypothetical protein